MTVVIVHLQTFPWLYTAVAADLGVGIDAAGVAARAQARSAAAAAAAGAYTRPLLTST